MLQKPLITIALLLLISSLSSSLNAKNKTYYGHLITSDNDTIRGRIWMLSPTLNEIKVKITDYQQKVQVYKANRLKSYHFKVHTWNKNTRRYDEEWIHYVKKQVHRSPVPFGTKSVLLHREVSGRISLYNHYISANSNVNQPYKHIFYIEKKHKHFLQINKANYKLVLNELMSDHPAIISKIGKRKYGFKYLSDIIEEYNYSIRRKTAFR